MKSDLLLKEEEKARAVLSGPVVQFIEECMARPMPASYLIAVLHRVQEHVGHLGREHMDAVSTLMQIPSAKVSGVASFYHFFTFKPRGRHRIAVCMGTACFVKGAGQVLDRLREMLGIGVGETTVDGGFSIDIARCVGACALAPVMIVDEKVYASVKPDQLPKILGEYGYSTPKKVAGSAAPAGKPA